MAVVGGRRRSSSGNTNRIHNMVECSHLLILCRDPGKRKIRFGPKNSTGWSEMKSRRSLVCGQMFLTRHFVAESVCCFRRPNAQQHERVDAMEEENPIKIKFRSSNTFVLFCDTRTTRGFIVRAATVMACHRELQNSISPDHFPGTGS